MIEQGGVLSSEDIRSLHEVANQLTKSINLLTNTWDGDLSVDTRLFEGR